ncbi:MAG: DNA primase, partial [Bacteroidaceae bacterium]|nr:DNA primase [Bacteroidaceae bacterium]
MIDRVTIDKIMDAARIEDVVSDFVNLKRAGANLKGLCPFHDDRTPSFMVSPAKNLCKCFACGKGGSPVGFIMEHEQLSYPDALRYLARKYGIPIEEKELSPEETQSRNDKDSMFIVNEWAKEWFEKQLHESVPGQAVGMMYFRSRGFRDDIIKKF